MGKEDSKKSSEGGSKPAFVKKPYKPKGPASAGTGSFRSEQDSKPDFNKSKFPRRIKRNDLVVQKEKQKMLHKYKKMMRKERQQGDKSATSGDPTTGTVRNVQYPRVNFGSEDKKYLTSNKKTQLEYDNKRKQQNLELEVSLNFNFCFCHFRRLNLYSIN
jgi:hypothetical protein